MMARHAQCLCGRRQAPNLIGNTGGSVAEDSLLEL